MGKQIKVPELVARPEGDVMILEPTEEKKHGRTLYKCKCVSCEREFKAVPKELRDGRQICPCQQGRRPLTFVPKGNKLTEEQLAYLGGLVDGEGHVTILKTKRKHRGDRPGYQAYMTIGHTRACLVNVQNSYSSKGLSRFLRIDVNSLSSWHLRRFTKHALTSAVKELWVTGVQHNPDWMIVRDCRIL